MSEDDRKDFYVKLEEFLREKDIRKFKGYVIEELTFSDGTSKNKWFKNYKDYIVSSNNDVC